MSDLRLSYKSPMLPMMLLAWWVMLGTCCIPTEQAYAAEDPVCANPPCVFVNIDSVTYFPSGQIRDVTVSNSKGTYLLSCNPTKKECIAPKLDDQDALVDQAGNAKTFDTLKDFIGAYTNEKTVFLMSTHDSVGVYWLEAYVPLYPSSEVQRLIAECKAKGRFLDNSNCAKWLSKREMTRKADCPDPDARVACNSFQELIAANDSDIVGDFATADHIYVCFKPKEDSFFEINFSEPDPFWEKATPEELKNGAIPGVMLQFGGAGVAYYKNGVNDAGMTIQNIGKWKYYPLGRPLDTSMATSSNSEFEGKNISIGQTQFVFTDKYKSKAGLEAKHEIVLQLPTGRYVETFENPLCQPE